MSIFYIFASALIALAGYFYIQLNRKAGGDYVTVSGGAHGKGSGHGSPTTPAGGSSPNSSTDNKEVLVLFGSQTGTAELFAKTLTREGAKMGVPIKICDVESYESFNLEYERLVILICATYGEGEPTDTMKDFHDWMFDDCRAVGEELANVKYTVFGLGDRQYKYFCEEGIVMDRRFDELGAKRIYGLSCGDSGGGQLEEQFDEWCKDLWPAVGRALNIKIKENTEEPVEPECRMKYWEEKEAPLPFPKTASVLEPTQRLPVWVPMMRNEELLKSVSDGNSTLAIDFNTSDTIISYQAGDHLGILPCNSDELVAEYLKVLNVSDEEAGRVFSLQDKKTLKNVFPSRVAPRTALKWYIDLAGVPKKSTLRAFAHCCTDAAQKEELLRILRVNPEAQNEFAKLCKKLRTMQGFLRHFDSAKVPLSFFLELMPRITPRYYSISSDILSTPNSVGTTIGIVKGGLCTSMLARMQIGDKVPVFVRKSTFHLPLRHKERPIIMVGPGTGVAPFIGFLERRRAWQQKGATLGKAILFFGCRRHAEDHIFEEYCTQALQDGVLSVLDTAYSRDQAYKIYVQHRVKERAAELWEMLSAGANVYVCGDAKFMAKDVDAELKRVVEVEGKMTPEAAAEFMKKMETEERYLKDVWSSTL
ncbi:putative p450 reductase [Leptomonas pyrrhocoris]|uniref:NADPH--hemoprotein reductase n=1 Tax=Leptomonas pyrrhocoris TaxID=157538 RepID=A0A0M9G9I5_LEPPY|nr:putative p450 reductase [Leptomonas pyrrhocoris]KPA85379.1 putative p450 reductase [Leptomonas pyrrhocoris]|eukprot:XP_015663818.1 putative p450 reductase [Leptomonas pyrrhocoris]